MMEVVVTVTHPEGLLSTWSHQPGNVEHGQCQRLGSQMFQAHHHLRTYLTLNSLRWAVILPD